MMKSRFSTARILAWSAIGIAACLNQGLAVEQPAGVAAATQDADEFRQAAIQAAGKAFATAFNANDAKAVAALWAEDGEFVNQSGERFNGRDEIEKQYADFFKEYPGVQIQLKINKIKLLSSTSAMEEGLSTLGAPDAPSPVSCHYLVIYVKKGSQWLMTSGHDLRTQVEEKYGNIEELSNFIGSWKYDGDDASYETKVSWIANNKFIQRTYTLKENGTVTQSGVQIIGVEPTTKQIASWSFDSNGGHDIGMWTNQGDRWIIESNGAMADGTQTSSLNELKFSDDNTMTWKSVNRMIGDQLAPDADPVVLTRDKGNLRNR